jgi:phosphatidyl-myo-inositol dimannoside synthase
VTVIPRQAPDPLGVLPRKLRFVTRGLNSKLKYARTVFLELVGGASFDLVVCGHINLLPFGYFASRLHRAPLALIIYGVDAWQPHRSLLINAIAKKVNSVVSISKVTLDKFLAWSAAQESSYYIIPNAIDLERFKPGQKSQALLERYRLGGKKVLMTVGRLAANERYKGVDEILDLLPSLQTEAPDVAYLVMGDGDDRRRLEEKARDLGVASQVVFTGYIAEEEKLSHYRLADVYVMPSRGEGFGFVFLEAMAAGVPAVASKVDGGREALRDGLLGVLVDPGQPDELRRGIQTALHRPQGVVPEGLEYFSYDNFERRVHQFLDTVCNPVRSSSI